MRSDEVIIAPLLTEKTNIEREQGKYSFRVDPRANKIEVMNAVRELFDVKPISCNVMRVKGKPKRVRYRAGRTSAWKKAIVTIAPGQTISIFEGA